MSAADRRAAYAALADEVPLASARIDAPWFQKHPGRTARVRPATADEAELARLRAGWTGVLQVGLRLFVVVQPDALPSTIRTFASADAAALLDLDDDHARGIFSALSARRGHGRHAPVVRVGADGKVLV